MHMGTGTGTGMGMGMGMGHWWQHIFGDQDVIDSIHGFKVQYDDDHVSQLSSKYIYIYILTMVNTILTMVNTILTMVNTILTVLCRCPNRASVPDTGTVKL